MRAGSEDPSRKRMAPGLGIIAIDGAAGTGKTTSAALVAERLGFCYVDSGAVYRAVALALLREGIAAVEDARISRLVPLLAFEIRPRPDRFRVFLDGREVEGAELRAPEVTRFSSKLAVRPDVREKVSALLRAAASLGPLVVEGRDIGTVVFPEAVLKVFLAADLAVRADRRRGDLLRQGVPQPVEEVARELAERDLRDSTRSDSPLRKAEGALVVDTGRTDIEGQVQAILEAYRRAIARAGKSGADGAPSEGRSQPEQHP